MCLIWVGSEIKGVICISENCILLSDIKIFQRLCLILDCPKLLAHSSIIEYDFLIGVSKNHEILIGEE
jgi:hypothetical protein